MLSSSRATGRSSTGALGASGRLTASGCLLTMRRSLTMRKSRSSRALEPTPEPSTWFICHHRAKARLHARSLATWISTALKEPTFLNGAEGDDLSSVLVEVSKAKALLLFLTEGCLLRPWLLLECFWACAHHVPIVPLFVAGGEYDYGAARHTLANLRDELEAHNPGAVEAIEAALEPLSVPFGTLAASLQSTIPHLISLPYSAHDSTTQMLALVSDIVERTTLAQEQTRKKDAATSFLEPARAIPRPKQAKPPSHTAPALAPDAAHRPATAGSVSTDGSEAAGTTGQVSFQPVVRLSTQAGHVKV